MTSREFRERLSKRTRRAGVALGLDAAERLEAYYRLLARWNTKISLTALPLVSPTDETFDRLLVEPLAAARYVADFPVIWFDLGSGGGSPAIPLKILRPRANLTMVESKARKAAFLREAVRELDLVDARVENARFEDISGGSAHMVDLVTVRAVRADSTLFGTAAELLTDGGRLLWFGAGREFIQAPTFQQLDTAVLADRPGSRLVVLKRVFHVEQTS